MFLKLLIQSVYNVLPNPSNLFCWGKVETPTCPVKGKSIHSNINQVKRLRPARLTITFVRAGEQPNPQLKTHAGLLWTARHETSQLSALLLGHRPGTDRSRSGHQDEGF